METNLSHSNEAKQAADWTPEKVKAMLDEGGMFTDLSAGEYQRIADEHNQTTVAATAKLRETNKRDGNWIDKDGACKVCDGEIPHGHTSNCDIWKLEQENAKLRTAIEHAIECALQGKRPNLVLLKQALANVKQV